MTDEQDRPADESEALDWLEALAAGKAETQARQVPQRFSMFGITAVLLSLGLLIAVGYALYQRGEDQLIGSAAPDFSVTTFDGERVDYANLKGRVIVLNFWASYCGPCRDEAPLLERVWLDYRDQDVIFLGINTGGLEDEDGALAYLDEFKITYPNAPDRGDRVKNAYRITGIPETFIIDTGGTVTRHFLARPDETELRAAIDGALKG